MNSQTVPTHTGMVLEVESHLGDNFDRAWSIPAPADTRLTVLGQFGYVLLPRFTLAPKRIFLKQVHSFQFRNIRKASTLLSTLINMSDNGTSDGGSSTSDSSANPSSASSSSYNIQELLRDDLGRTGHGDKVDQVDGEKGADDKLEQEQDDGKMTEEELAAYKQRQVTQSNDDDDDVQVTTKPSKEDTASDPSKSKPNVSTRSQKNLSDSETLKQCNIPHLKIYRLGNTVTSSNIPYKASAKGLGVNLCESPYCTVFVTEQGDGFRFNEPKNFYGQSIVKAVIEKMKTKKVKIKGNGKRIGERPFFDDVMKHEVKSLIDRSGFEEEGITSRQLELTWKVWRGFNTEGDYNELLRKICIRYARIRLGVDPRPGDEFIHAIFAVQDEYIDITKDNNNAGDGGWTFPILHLMNQHIENYLDIPKIQFHPSDNADKTAKMYRNGSSTKIWVDDDKQRIQVSVEARPIAVELLLDFVNDGVEEADRCALASDLGPPDDALPARANKRKRRSLADEY